MEEKKKVIKKNKPKFSFYLVSFLLVFCIVGSLLGTIAFCQNNCGTKKVKADEPTEIIEYDNLISFYPSYVTSPMVLVNSNSIYTTAPLVGSYFQISANISLKPNTNYTAYSTVFGNTGVHFLVQLSSSSLGNYTVEFRNSSIVSFNTGERSICRIYLGSDSQSLFSGSLFLWEGTWNLNNITDSMKYQIGYSQGILDNYDRIYQQGYTEGYSQSYEEFNSNFNANTMLNPFVSNNVVFGVLNGRNFFDVPYSLGDNYLFFPTISDSITGDFVMRFNYPFLLTKYNFSPNLYSKDFNQLFDYKRLNKAYYINFTFYLENITDNTNSSDIDPGFSVDYIPLERRSHVNISYILSKNGFEIVLPNTYFDRTIGTTTVYEQGVGNVTYPGSMQPFSFDSMYIFGVKFDSYSVADDIEGTNAVDYTFNTFDSLSKFVLLFNGFGADYSSGYNQGYKNGYNQGYAYGYSQGTYNAGTYTFTSLIGAVVDAPITAVSGLLNFEILGVNLLNFFFGILTIAIIIFVIRLFL